MYTTYHTGQNIVWAYWMRTAFSLSQDPAVLRQALAAGSRSVAGFVEDMVAALSEQLRRERAELARSSHARRFEVVSLILESAPITTGRASTRLGYDLRRRHTAAVLWTDPRRPDQAALAAGRRGARPRGPRPAGADRDRQLLLGVGLGEQFSAVRAARALYTHRNTVLNRLQRAERLLPFPLAGHGLEVGVALEIAQWLGTQPGRATHDG